MSLIFIFLMFLFYNMVYEGINNFCFSYWKTWISRLRISRLTSPSYSYFCCCYGILQLTFLYLMSIVLNFVGHVFSILVRVIMLGRFYGKRVVPFRNEYSLILCVFHLDFIMVLKIDRSATISVWFASLNWPAFELPLNCWNR